MGYYSEVAYLIEFEDREQMEGFVATQVVAGNVWDMEEFKVSKLEYGRWQLVYHAENTKWYDDYKDIQAHERFMECAREAGYPVGFIRIGENYDDIETKFSDNSDYRLGVHRYIDIPIGFDGEKSFSFTKKEADEQPRAGEHHQRDVA